MTTLFLLLISFLAIFVCFCPFPDIHHPLGTPSIREEHETASESATAAASTPNGQGRTSRSIESGASHPFPRKRHTAPKHSSRVVTRSASVPTLTITRVAHESSASSLS